MGNILRKILGKGSDQPLADLENRDPGSALRVTTQRQVPTVSRDFNNINLKDVQMFALKTIREKLIFFSGEVSRERGQRVEILYGVTTLESLQMVLFSTVPTTGAAHFHL